MLLHPSFPPFNLPPLPVNKEQNLAIIHQDEPYTFSGEEQRLREVGSKAPESLELLLCAMKLVVPYVFFICKKQVLSLCLALHREGLCREECSYRSTSRSATQKEAPLK